jgi:hypothetical protein
MRSIPLAATLATVIPCSASALHRIKERAQARGLNVPAHRRGPCAGMRP